jgi:hypothetical protein
LLMMGDDVDWDIKTSFWDNVLVFSIVSDGFSVLMGSVFVRMEDGSDRTGGVKRGRRWNGMNADTRILAAKHWWHRQERRVVGSVINKHLFSCLKKEKFLIKKPTKVQWTNTFFQYQYNYFFEH